jgi:hypothetical protein
MPSSCMRSTPYPCSSVEVAGKAADMAAGAGAGAATCIDARIAELIGGGLAGCGNCFFSCAAII